MKKKPRRQAFVPRQLTPDQYFEHWLARKVWTHLEYPKHQRRLHWCADNVTGELFADVGCMLGHSTSIMKKRRPGRWVGIDFCAEAIKGAKELFPTIPFHFLESPADLPGLSDRRIDTIVCSEVIEHVKDDAAFLEALVGAAHKRVLLTTPCIDAQDPGHVRIYSVATLQALLEGFSASWSMDDSFFYVRIEVSR
jgi:SAM-dependent methyltransferase